MDAFLCRSLPDFNPRSREGSDIYIDATGIVATISIHAPARGATSVSGSMNGSRYISIHAPARGATIASSPLSSGLIRFQSTLPRGERLFPTFFDTSVRIISIHAPARGATYKMACSVSLNVFQSTLPRGERPNAELFCAQWTDFNPRSREGSD